MYPVLCGVIEKAKEVAGDMLNITVHKIKNNFFGSAPVGAAIYSIISPEAEAQVTIDNNKYTKNDVLLNRWGGENYNDLEAYKAATGNDKNSCYAE